MVNNFQQIASFLDFNSEDEFYFCQIIKRKKENPELGSNNVVIHSYYISSKEQLLSFQQEIIMLCALHNARAYINLNRCSYEKVAFHTLKGITDHIMNKEYKSVKRSYNTTCGKYTIENPKKWIIDIDIPESESREVLINTIIEFTRMAEPNVGTYKHCDIIKTKNGVHLISLPFNLQEFKQVFTTVDVHKNNPTLLYC